MHFHIVTNVWGERHVAFFLDVTLRNVLSARNLPAMGAYGRVTYRIFTTLAGQHQISQSPIFKALTAVCEVEFVTPLGDRTPDVVWHVHWFHRSTAEAKLAGACPVFIPPDTLWTDGSLEFFAQKLAEGYDGVACPFLLVNSDTLVSELEAYDDGTAITLTGAETSRLGLRHLHPLHMLAMPGAPHARPGFEMHWAADSNVMHSRYAVRELVAFDPNKCPITFLWYAGGGPSDARVYFGDDSDDMLMLSVDPISKYPQNYILGHSMDPIDLSRTTMHPLNDTGHTRAFVREDVRIHGDDSEANTRQQSKSLAAAIEMEAGRRALQIVRALEQNGATQLAKLVSVAIFETPLLRRWRDDEPLDFVAFTDRLLAQTFGEELLRLVEPGREAKLRAFLMSLRVPKGESAVVSLGDADVSIDWTETDRPKLATSSQLANSLDIEGSTVWLFAPL